MLFSGNFIGLLWGCDCAIVDVFLIGSPTSICFFQIVYECRITFVLKCIKSEHVIQAASKFVFGSDQRCFFKVILVVFVGFSFRKQPNTCATNS